MTDRERKKRFRLALKWAREEQAAYLQKRTDKALGGLCIAAIAVWARAHDQESCEEMCDLLREVSRLLGEEEEQNAKTTRR